MLYSGLVITSSKSRVAEFSRKRAEQQARLVDPGTLAHAVSQNVEAQTFCLWARLSVYMYGRRSLDRIWTRGARDLRSRFPWKNRQM